MIEPLIVEDGFFKACNLNCEYCRSKTSKKNKKGFYDEVRGILYDQEKLHDHLSMIESLHKHTTYGSFKISSHGEITLLPNFLQFLNKNNQNILLTNGTHLNENLIKELQNFDVILQISLDGHTKEMNFARKINPNEILKQVNLLIKYDIPVEINTVISKYNAASIGNFLKFLTNIESEILSCIPFPVRDFSTKNNKQLSPSMAQIENLESNLNSMNYDFTITPKAYLIYLIDFLKYGRKLPCFLPRMVLAWNYNYDILYCPCGPTEIYANLKEIIQINNKEEPSSASLLTTHENPLLYVSKPKDFLCQGCFTHYDLINLFILGLLEENEIKKVPTFRNDTFFNLLQRWKHYWRKTI